MRGGYKDLLDTIIIEPQFLEAHDFKEGLAVVRTREGQAEFNYGYINIKGDMIIPAVFNGAYGFNDGIARVMFSEYDGDYRYSYINKEGDILFDGKEYLDARDFSEGYALVLKKGYVAISLPEDIKNNRYSFINKSGEYATELEFEQARPFNNGLAAVKNNGKWGLINTKFELVVNYLYDSINELNTR